LRGIGQFFRISNFGVFSLGLIRIGVSWQARYRVPRSTLPNECACRDSNHLPQAHPELRLGEPGPLVAPSTATPRINDTQPQASDGCPSTFVDNSHHHASRTSRSLSAASQAVLVAKYQEWPFQGFLKRIRIGDDVPYNLKFKLPSISEQLLLPTDPNALDICSSRVVPAKVPAYHDVAIHSKTRLALL
jgi:hypothetical protein